MRTATQGKLSPFSMINFSFKDSYNAICERLLRESDLTLSRDISTGHAAEETQKHNCEILQSQSTVNLHKINKLCKLCHQAPNEKSKEIIRKCKICNSSHVRGNCPLSFILLLLYLLSNYEKFIRQVSVVTELQPLKCLLQGGKISEIDFLSFLNSSIFSCKHWYIGGIGSCEYMGFMLTYIG